MNKRLEDSLKKALLEIGRLKSDVKFLRAENAQLQMQQVSFSNLHQSHNKCGSVSLFSCHSSKDDTGTFLKKNSLDR
jgi:hypothetical protein